MSGEAVLSVWGINFIDFEVPFRFSTEDRVINITLKEPTISLKGQYDLNMKVAIMDVYGKGDLAVNLSMVLFF